GEEHLAAPLERHRARARRHHHGVVAGVEPRAFADRITAAADAEPGEDESGQDNTARHPRTLTVRRRSLNDVRLTNCDRFDRMTMPGAVAVALLLWCGCGPSHQLGGPDGGAPCSTSDDCDGLTCSVDGVCIPNGTCVADGDCAPGETCADNTCQPAPPCTV